MQFFILYSLCQKQKEFALCARRFVWLKCASVAKVFFSFHFHSEKGDRFIYSDNVFFSLNFTISMTLLVLSVFFFDSCNRNDEILTLAYWHCCSFCVNAMWPSNSTNVSMTIGSSSIGIWMNLPSATIYTHLTMFGLFSCICFLIFRSIEIAYDRSIRLIWLTFCHRRKWKIYVFDETLCAIREANELTSN